MSQSVDYIELYDYLKDYNVRHQYLGSSIRQLVAMQIKAMREDREWSQSQVGEKTGMKQSAIARLEDPRHKSMTLVTLQRLAKAFDVALVVHFGAFTEFVSWTSQLNNTRLAPPDYEQERQMILVEALPSNTDNMTFATDKDSNSGLTLMGGGFGAAQGAPGVAAASEIK